jgi:hypothetical protein
MPRVQKDPLRPPTTPIESIGLAPIFDHTSNKLGPEFVLEKRHGVQCLVAVHGRVIGDGLSAQRGQCFLGGVTYSFDDCFQLYKPRMNKSFERRALTPEELGASR